MYFQCRENDIVANVISEQGANTSSYIGLIRNEENLDEWLWADGSEVSYTNWNDGEPNNKNEKAGEVYDNKDQMVQESGMTAIRLHFAQVL